MNKSSLAREHSSLEMNWKQQFKNAIKNIDVLCDTLNLREEQLLLLKETNKNFPLRVPWSYVNRINKSDPNDPLLLQILPQAHEEINTPGFVNDPVGDLSSIKSAGLLQKYPGRALLLATSQCGVHCRYCFRQHFPYSNQNPRTNAWENSINELSKDKTINEVILSGGDPLILDDSELSKLAKKLEQITHIRRLRIHTRLPIVIPDRINESLFNWIDKLSLKIVIVLHINHAQELNSYLSSKLQDLSKTNCTLLNQSVLLKNINDNPQTLINLSEALFSTNVLPYYIHLLDKVQGSAHFEVNEARAISIMREVSSRLPGYLVPKLVKEVAGQTSKTIL